MTITGVGLIGVGLAYPRLPDEVAIHFNFIGEPIEEVGYDGRVVQIGMGRLEATIDTYPLIMKCLTLSGNTGGSKNAIASVLKHIASGDLSPSIEYTDFDSIAEGIDRLHDGKVRGRLVAIY